VPALGGEKSGQFDRPSQGHRLQPPGRFAQSYDEDFANHLPGRIGFDLFGGVFQHPFADRDSRRRVAQDFALVQPAGKLDAV